VFWENEVVELIVSVKVGASEAAVLVLVKLKSFHSPQLIALL
jgi:hypothetical protein